MSTSPINGSRLTFDTATFRKFINSVLHTKSTTEIREESVENDGGIGAVMTNMYYRTDENACSAIPSSLQMIISPHLNCRYASVLSVSLLVL